MINHRFQDTFRSYLSNFNQLWIFCSFSTNYLFKFDFLLSVNEILLYAWFEMQNHQSCFWILRFTLFSGDLQELYLFCMCVLFSNIIIHSDVNDIFLFVKPLIFTIVRIDLSLLFIFLEFGNVGGYESLESRQQNVIPSFRNFSSLNLTAKQLKLQSCLSF